MLLVSRIFPVSFSMTIHGPEEFNDTDAFHMADKVAAASLVTTISRFASSQVMRASDPDHWPKIRTVPLGVDPGDFTPRPAPSGFEILCVGRLAPVKAHIVLIAAVGRLVSVGRKDVRLVLIGDGPSRQAIEREIARRNLTGYVRLEGALNHDRVLDFYRRASVFALASFAEGVPVVLMEAMAMEVPCVATWIAGVPELIRNGVDGLLVPPADEDALASAIARLMDDPELASRLGRSGRKRIVECYHLAKNVASLAATFRAAVDHDSA
jgi:glycosyltransferase involved in cell wall biosynthesis